MNDRKQLFQKALTKSMEAFDKAPYMFPLESVIEQLKYLIGIEEGINADSSQLNTINLGQIAARDIEQLDSNLAELLHDVSAEVTKMKAFLES
jgi:hypothetical protein